MKPETNKLDEALRAAMVDLRFGADGLENAARLGRKHRDGINAARTLALAAARAAAKVLAKVEAGE